MGNFAFMPIIKYCKIGPVVIALIRSAKFEHRWPRKALKDAFVRANRRPAFLLMSQICILILVLKTIEFQRKNCIQASKFLIAHLRNKS